MRQTDRKYNYIIDRIVCVVRHIREKCETELREVEKSERSTLQKFNEMKVQQTSQLYIHYTTVLNIAML